MANKTYIVEYYNRLGNMVTMMHCDSEQEREVHRAYVKDCIATKDKAESERFKPIVSYAFFTLAKTTVTVSINN